MKTVALSAVALITVLVALAMHSQPLDSFDTPKLRFDDVCPEPLAVECLSTIQISIRDCSQAAKHPTDINAEVDCVKDLLSDKKLCWPCICEASKKFIKVTGCPS